MSPPSPSRSRPTPGAVMDLLLVLVGPALMVLSFFPYYVVGLPQAGSDWRSAWVGFFGWFGALVALVGSLLMLVARGVSRSDGPRWGEHLRPMVLVAFCVALLSVVLAGAVWPLPECAEEWREICRAAQRSGWAFWASLLTLLGAAPVAAMRVRA